MPNISPEIHMEQKILVTFGEEFIGSGQHWEGGCFFPPHILFRHL